MVCIELAHHWRIELAHLNWSMEPEHWSGALNGT
jgi:hypothetical protein